MLPDRVSNPGPLSYESGALPIALRGPACPILLYLQKIHNFNNLYFAVLTNCPESESFGALKVRTYCLRLCQSPCVSKK